MALEKPIELLRFISDIKVLEDGIVPIDTLDHQPFVSELYTPNYSLSVLARITQSVLSKGDIEPTSHDLEPHTIVYKILHSDLADESPDVYLLMRLVVLESFALVYHIDEERKQLIYTSPRDIVIIRNNINYIGDYFSTVERFRPMIETLRDMSVALGYIENQIDVIVHRGVRDFG
ncbi:hypothetical protein BH753_gp129 [Bacillus phage Shbh1]|uniref:Uncharacterized protein n=1 Tax=Bacillus phage Shbh1 TaxID=1796992 RepID=A0A142F1F4_9CAUD|nr:hypothetical protein BH753_gp129 [Bacillus phage Shbh1]AMQ66611.1 hypothetical protein [Bacillus phage Shbh1]